MNFDPNARAASDSGVFGLPHSAEQARLILIAVPWEATTSYGGGTARGPEAILNASRQVDLFDLETGKAYESGYHMLPLPTELVAKNSRAKEMAEKVRELEDSSAPVEKIEHLQDQVNQLCQEMNAWVYQTAKTWLAKGKLVGLVGGDHSTPLGLIQALSENLKGDFGVLHIDAHHDLREAYEGFTYSHASIFWNVMEQKWAPKKLAQVGIRDFSEEEFLYAKEKNISVLYDIHAQQKKAQGVRWSDICAELVQTLPKNIYVSFDIDGLAPTYCPNTGTPVPGGLEFGEALVLLKTIRDSGRKIVGFDLNEVSPGSSDSEWDGNVGARMLYKLCGWTIVSQS